MEHQPKVDQKVVFMGKMAARMTHEIRNILSIIKESSGLIDDVLSINQGTALKNRDILKRSLTRIDEQIPRGLDLLNQFNHLAHSMDEQVASIEINDFLEHVTAIMTCFARLKKVQLNLVCYGSQLVIRSNPFRLHWILSSCIEYMLEGEVEGSTITIRTEASQNGSCIYILPGSDIPAPSELTTSLPADLSFLKSELKDLGIRVLSKEAPGKKCLLLDMES